MALKIKYSFLICKSKSSQNHLDKNDTNNPSDRLTCFFFFLLLIHYTVCSIDFFISILRSWKMVMSFSPRGSSSPYSRLPTTVESLTTLVPWWVWMRRSCAPSRCVFECVVQDMTAGWLYCCVHISLFLCGLWTGWENKSPWGKLKGYLIFKWSVC